jgi:hypothetical protein
MSKYRLYGLVAATKMLGVVEANSPEEAVSMAWTQRDTHISLCHQCSNELDAEEIYKIEAELED